MPRSEAIVGFAHGSSHFGAVLFSRQVADTGSGAPRSANPGEDFGPAHEPVMVEEVLEALSPSPGAVVVDGTMGQGGHSLALIERIAPGGTLLGFEWDPAMLAIAQVRIGDPRGVKVEFVSDDFREIPRYLFRTGRTADAILLDLGLNTGQVLDPKRGFSFAHDAPLDMRMDRGRGEPASAVLNRMSPVQIEDMLRDFGDEKWARAIAKKIVEVRKSRPLTTTFDLVECVLAAIPKGAREKRIHPATRTFQSVRAYVNRELQGLEEALGAMAAALSPQGVLAVISYHSGEDRIVKHAFRSLEATERFESITRKPRTPSASEVERNPRSRSAKLRAVRRLLP